ncbi:MAG: hypothetical protein VX404_01325 [Planctomycetota bacterium]|nr:hypothetical protein [Planctomycetota bacterium]
MGSLRIMDLLARRSPQLLVISKRVVSRFRSAGFPGEKDIDPSASCSDPFYDKITPVVAPG